MASDAMHHLMVAKPKVPPAPAGGTDWQSRLSRHVLHEDWFSWNRMQKAEFLKTEVRAQILLGITICFAQIPESVAFAFMAHTKPPVHHRSPASSSPGRAKRPHPSLRPHDCCSQKKSLEDVLVHE